MSEHTRRPRPMWAWILGLLVLILVAWLAWHVIRDVGTVEEAAESPVSLAPGDVAPHPAGGTRPARIG